MPNPAHGLARLDTVTSRFGPGWGIPHHALFYDVLRVWRALPPYRGDSAAAAAAAAAIASVADVEGGLNVKQPSVDVAKKERAGGAREGLLQEVLKGAQLIAADSIPAQACGGARLSRGTL